MAKICRLLQKAHQTASVFWSMAEGTMMDRIWHETFQDKRMSRDPLDLLVFASFMLEGAGFADVKSGLTFEALETLLDVVLTAELDPEEYFFGPIRTLIENRPSGAIRPSLGIRVEDGATIRGAIKLATGELRVNLQAAKP